eukprot:CAMPEP_0206403446 /NCGR_PEP_ID=MMETSP0294-20121207/27689_1 /ASSEMBLY_ACC=CAM_ASM_000327 /TAXON_ID=39354 /ORGANISM="Heterosigma akashiwo, Strain CCMP2393" /LENGTH=104 /DNA_ID=CAMNT_0053860977 /DNA_START=160 /DNA_END=473 /DNA_ORIENTATION=-
MSRRKATAPTTSDSWPWALSAPEEALHGDVAALEQHPPAQREVGALCSSWCNRGDIASNVGAAAFIVRHISSIMYSASALPIAPVSSTADFCSSSSPCPILLSV